MQYAYITCAAHVLDFNYKSKNHCIIRKWITIECPWNDRTSNEMNGSSFKFIAKNVYFIIESNNLRFQKTEKQRKKIQWNKPQSVNFFSWNFPLACVKGENWISAN